MHKDSLPDFSGKCISMRIKHSDYSHDLYDPHFEYQGGRLFLIGTIPEDSSESGWDDNQTGAVDWEGVRSYVLFENLETYVKAVKKAESFKPKKGKKK